MATGARGGFSSRNTHFIRKYFIFQEARTKKKKIRFQMNRRRQKPDQMTFSRRDPALIISLLQESRVKGVRPDVGPSIKQRRAGGCWRSCASASIIDEPRSGTIRAESGGLVWPRWSFQPSNPAIYISAAPWWGARPPCCS